MKSRFNSYLDNIDVDFWRDLCRSKGETRNYGKGEEFIKAGSIGRYLGYIESGAMKYESYDENGFAYVVGLEFAGHFVADFPFSLFGHRSRCSIIACSPCIINCLSISWLTDQMKRDERLREIVFQSTVELFGMVYDRHMGIYKQTPMQRLNELLSSDPELFQNFSLQDIASLLNITPTHLSRLRKKT